MGHSSNRSGRTAPLASARPPQHHKQKVPSGSERKSRCAGKGIAESASLDLPTSIGALNSRIDRDAAGQWKTTQSFGRNDLLVLAKVADRAHSRIFELQQAEDESEQAV